MYIEMACSCEASLTMEVDDDNPDTVWHLAWRFASAHVICGYVTPGISSEVESEKTVKKKIIKPKKVSYEEDEDDE